MKTIKTRTHLLLVDETADLFEGDKASSLEGLMMTIDKGWNNSLKLNMHKIIAASPKLGDLPEFETLLPNTENDVEIEKICEKYWKTAHKHSWLNCLNHFAVLKAMVLGYKAKSETMFSLEQIKQVINCAFVFSEGKDENETYQDCEDFCLEQVSLTKPKEYEFVVEMEWFNPKTNKVSDALPNITGLNDNDGCFLQPKIVNNKIQGVWKELK